MNDFITEYLIDKSPFNDGCIVTDVLEKGSTRIDFLMKNGSTSQERLLRVTAADPEYGPTAEECYAQAEQLSPELTSCVFNVKCEDIDGKEYCLAQTAKSISELNMPVMGVVGMGIDICTALDEINGQGYLHRNIKPANISYHNGVYYLNSFDLMERFELCGSDNIAGTPSYMAPEAYKAGEYNLTTDIYALGITMYQMLSGGDLPFTGAGYSTRGTNNLRLSGNSIPFIPGIAPELMDIVLKACSFEPENRYRSANDMLTALRNYFRGRSRTGGDDLEYIKQELMNIPEFSSRWFFEDYLGAGSYGAVFRVSEKNSDENAGKPYALKVISVPSFAEARRLQPSSDNEQLRLYMDRLITKTSREPLLWEILSGCRNTVRLLEFNKVKRGGGVPGFYYWMLSELLAPIENSIPNEITVAQIAYDVCAALADAHAKGIVHRDVKPGNILYSADEGYQLGDFGVSKVHINTVSGTVIGTVDYMAPELLRYLREGRASGEYDHTVDIYSLGLTMYTLLNENLGPFMRDRSGKEISNDKLQREKADCVFPPARNASEGIMRIIRKACAGEPEKRYKTAEDMREALRNFMTE